jgi:predicted restriction endonuclease
VDYGDVIIYTGHGGRDPRTGQQTHDQPFTRGNRALALSKQNGLPVRVVRGSNQDSPLSPPSGYSYDGLYAVDKYWHEIGKSGFRIWRFSLVKIPNATPAQQTIAEEPAKYSVPNRREVRGSQGMRHKQGRSKHFTTTDARYAGPVCDGPQAHIQKLLTYVRSAHRTTVKTRRTTRSAYVRTITCSSTTAPSRSLTIYL